MSSNELAGTQATISLGDVLGAVASRVERQFEAVLGDLPHQEPGNRPQALLQFIHGARQQLLRSAAILHDTRKFMAAQPLVEPGGILDVAASHVRSMRQAADELHSAGIQLQGGRVPLYNMPDALDVLATGTYNNFPKEVPALPGQPTGQTAMQIPLSEVQKQRLTNQMNHMLYSRLLKAHLPSCLQLVKVVGGYAVVRCKGLYEAQLYLLKRPYPPQVEEARQDAAADAAEQLQEQQQLALQEAGTSAAAEAQPVLADTATAAAQQASSSSKQEPDRWVWAVWHAVILPNAAQKSPLRLEQLVPMLHLLRARMDAAVDAAAVEAARQQGTREGGGGPAAIAAEQSQQRSGPASTSGGPSQPTASGISGPAVSTVSGATDHSAAAGRVDAGRGLDFRKHAADETTVPLIIMHGVLRDIAAQLLLDEATAKANRLAGAGSKWEGHLRLTRAEVLTPGVRMHYWQKVPVLLAAQPAGVAASSSSTDNPPGLPAVELGVGSDGTVQVMHLPPLRQPGSLQQVPLLFDSHTVDVEGLLLQAVALTASTHLQQLQKFITQGLQKRGLGQFAQLHFSSLGTGRLAPAGVSTALAVGSNVAVAAVGGGSPAAADGGVPVGMPSSLVVSLDGNALVGVSFQPWSGKILLRPGSMYGGHRNMEMGIHLYQQQEILQQKQEQAKHRRTASTSEQQAAQQCLLELGQSIADICGDLWLKMQLSSFLAAARRFALHHTNHTLKGLHQQHVPTLQLPSAAAAMGQGGVGSSAAAAGKPSAAAAAVGHVSVAGRAGSTLHLAMPNLQLPPYMLLLASGRWCQDRLRQRKTAPPAAAAVPSMVAAVGPTLCLSFPRRRVAGESRDWLLLMLCDAQGLAGPVLKSVRIPVTCFTQQITTATEAEAGNVTRKRRRDGDSEQQQQQQQDVQQPDNIAEPPAGAEASAVELAKQRQDQPQQQQRQRQEPVFRVSPEDHAAELAAAVQWCQSRITFERLLLEMHALQLQFMQVQQQQQPGLWQQPAVQLLAIPGVDLFRKLQRKDGCCPSSVGLSEVWFLSGPEYGMWSMQLRGSFYHQAQQQQRRQQQRQHGPGESRPVPHYSGDPSLEQVTHYQYDLALGHDVRSAILQLVRIIHVQQFLHRVETLALGNQSLQVLNVEGNVLRDSIWGAKARSASEAAAAAAAGASGEAAGDAAAAAAAAAEEEEEGDVKQAMDAMDVDGDDAPDAKRHKLQQQQQFVDVHCHLANGPVLMNGVKQENEQQQEQAGADGVSSAQPAVPAPSQANGVAAAAAGGHTARLSGSSTAATRSSIASTVGSPYGLLFQWQGTGLVRLAQYSIAEAVLECGAPLAPPPAAAQPATAAVKLEPGSSGTPLAQQQQQQRRQRRSTCNRLCFTVTWQPRFEFGTHRSSSSSSSVYGSSSSSTLWVDVRPSTMQRGSTSANGWPAGKAAQPADVLAMACSISCNAPHVPADALNELSDMVDSGCVDVLLDSLAVAAWPLGAVADALAGGTAATGGSAAAADGDDSSALGAAALGAADHHSRKPLLLLQGMTAQHWGAAAAAGALIPAAAGAQVPAAAGVLTPAAGVVQALQQLGVNAVSSSALSGIFDVRYKFVLLPLQRQQPPQGSDSAGDGSSSSQTAAAAVQYTAGALAVELMFASHGRTKMLVTYEPGTIPQQKPSSSAAAAVGDASNAPAPAATAAAAAVGDASNAPAPAATAAAAAAGEYANNAPATAAALQMLTVDLPAALEGFYKHIMTEGFVSQQQGLSLLPVLPSGRYLTSLPQPGSLAAREGLAGFYVQNQHLGFVLQQLLRYWQQCVIPEAVVRSRGKGAAVSAVAATAPAAAVEAAAPAGQQQQQQQQPMQQIKQELASSQQLAVQQQQPVAMAVDVPGVPHAAAQALPQQQQQQQQQQFLQQQQQQQQQQHVTPNHLMHQMHQPAAGHVASGR